MMHCESVQASLSVSSIAVMSLARWSRLRWAAFLALPVDGLPGLFLLSGTGFWVTIASFKA
ncbi:MAG: hypothetical protein K2P57_11700 [Burkholderiales bacterium]|nr:hypothetical protein [Burkholderiales bacterium]